MKMPLFAMLSLRDDAKNYLLIMQVRILSLGSEFYITMVI